MDVKQEISGNKGVFYIEDKGQQIAVLTYVFAGETKFIIEHTEVNPGNEGKGLGKQLVDAAAEYARKNELKILPLCPYAKKVMEKSDAYKDVLF